MSDVARLRMPSGIPVGAAYYPEYHDPDRLDEDLDLMLAAGIRVIRVGESVWSTWEPRDGHFDLEWLEPVLNGAYRRGIAAILGTPTYAIPPWLQQKHPELAAEEKSGVPVSWGGRQEVDYSSDLFRRYAERIVRAVVGRYAEHPAVVGFQVDNEPGLRFFHNDHVFRRFVSDLRARYGTTDVLNEAWGLTYWSHRLNDWSELWKPDGNRVPQYDLAWRRFQAQLTSEFIEWQQAIVREYAHPMQFVTTCIAYSRPAVDDRALGRVSDVVSANLYFGTQDRLDLRKTVPAFEPWVTSGVPALFGQADRAYSSRGERFLVTETNAESVAGPHQNYPPYPGQLQLAALALVSRGASLIEYWNWHSLHFGAETYWGGVLPHSQRPGRIYHEVSEVASTLDRIGQEIEGYEPDADLAVIHSLESDWAMQFMPPFSVDGDPSSPDRASYTRVFDAFYRGAFDAGAQSRIVLVSQVTSERLDRYRTVVVPGLYISSDAELDALVEYARGGGHLVVGPRSGYADRQARARAQIAPPRISESAGVWYEEFSNLDSEVAVRERGNVLGLAPGAAGTSWIDFLVADRAEVLAEYDHPEFGRFPAVTTQEVGAGRITYVGTVPGPVLARDILRFAAGDLISAPWRAPSGVAVASGVNSRGSRIWFLSNWTDQAASVLAPVAVRDLLGGLTYAPGDPIALSDWEGVVLAEQ